MTMIGGRYYLNKGTNIFQEVIMKWVTKITQSKVWQATMNVVSKIWWPRTQAVINGGVYYRLTESDHDALREMLKSNYFVIATRKCAHLSSWLIPIGDLFLTGRWSHYTHVLINTEGDIDGHIGFKLLEANNSTDVAYTTFMKAFDCDSVALMVPKGVTPTEWTAVIDLAKSKVGTPYDTLFDLASAERMSCVEVIYWGLKQLPNFEQRFPKLIELINKGSNLTPQMFYDSGEFEVVVEIRR